jgi:hypothetical protein
LGPTTERRERLTLILWDPHELVASRFEILATEVASIFDPIGVDIRWKSDSGSTVYRLLDELLVVVQAGHAAPRHRANPVMGSIINAKALKHTIFTYPGTVAQTLGFEPGQMSPARSSQLARALGRVIAHEVVHAVARAHPHSQEGLMQPHLDRSSLLQDRMEIDEKCVAAFVQGLSDRSEGRRDR